MLDVLIGKINEGTSGLEMDGAVNRPEMDSVREPVELSPAVRDELEMFVRDRTPCRHKFNDSKGRACIVYFDERGRATDSPMSEVSGGELVRLAKSFGWLGDGMAGKGSADPGYDMPVEEGVVPGPGQGVVTSIPILGTPPKEEDLSDDIKEALAKVRGEFGDYRFDVNRAWLAGISKNTLLDLVDTGLVRVEDGGQYQIVPIRVREVAGWDLDEPR